jgi:hypothetical protein
MQSVYSINCHSSWLQLGISLISCFLMFPPDASHLQIVGSNGAGRDAVQGAQMELAITDQIGPHYPPTNVRLVLAHILIMISHNNCEFLDLPFVYSSCSFTDLDIDAGEIGGTVKWNGAESGEEVAYYDVCFGASPTDAIGSPLVRSFDTSFHSILKRNLFQHFSLQFALFAFR